MRNWFIGLVAFLVLCASVAIASAQMVDLTPGELWNLRLKAVNAALTKARNTSSTASSATKQAVNCEVQRAVKTAIPGVFTCSAGCC